MSREQLELAYPDLTGKERAAVVARLRKAGLVGGTGRIAVTGQGRWLDQSNRAPAPDVDAPLAALDRPAPRAARRGPADAVTTGTRIPGTGTGVPTEPVVPFDGPRSRGRLRRTEDRIMSTVARLSDSIGGRDSGTVTTAQLQTALPDVPDADRQTIFDDLVERGLLVVNPDGTIRLTASGRERQPGSPRLTGAQRFGMTLAPEDEDQAHMTPQARRLTSARMTVRRLIAAAGGDLSNLPDTIAAADWRRLVAAGDLRLRPGVDPMRGLRGSDLELTAQGRETLRPEPGMLGQPGRPQPATGQDWRAAMREITDRLREQMSRPEQTMTPQQRDRTLALETRALGQDVTPGNDQLHHYWTRGEGLRKWRGSPHPWTTLRRHLLKYMNPAMATRAASKWFQEVFGYTAGSDLHRVGSGKPPRGKVIGPG